MQKRQAEIKAKYASNPQKQQEELGKLMKEFGSPLAGCLPLLVQMPILFALFATLRGSPFADLPYTLNLKVLPADQIAAVEPKPFNSPSHSIFVTATSHVPVIASLEKGTKLGVGDTENGRPAHQRWQQLLLRAQGRRKRRCLRPHLEHHQGRRDRQR
jgi:YidC/Oxa1 family membrane protein insertase